jgi:hypothetical protein
VVVSGGKFITNNVAAGDVVHINYSLDDAGVETYDAYTIDRVVSEEVVMLLTGPAAEIDLASRIEVVRSLTRNQIAANYAAAPRVRGVRVMNVYPDTVEVGDKSIPSYFLAAAIAGLRSGSAPHQPLTNVEISGFDSVKRTTEFMSTEQLNIMAAGGTWIVTQDPESGAIITRHALTTADYSVEIEREESYTSNLDSISRAYYDVFKKYIGNCNLTDALLELIQGKVDALTTQLTRSVSFELGPQLIACTVASLRKHELYKDRSVLELNCTLPGPHNNMDIYIVAD